MGRCYMDSYPWKFEYFSISSQLWEQQSAESLFQRGVVSPGVLLDVGNLDFRDILITGHAALRWEIPGDAAVHAIAHGSTCFA